MIENQISKSSHSILSSEGHKEEGKEKEHKCLNVPISVALTNRLLLKLILTQCGVKGTSQLLILTQ